MMENKYIRADLFMHRIANETLFSPADLTLIKCVMEQEPGEDVKPVVHAHWNDDGYGFYSCSNCGYEWFEREYYTKYCPECGAKMDEEEGNDTRTER